MYLEGCELLERGHREAAHFRKYMVKCNAPNTLRFHNIYCYGLRSTTPPILEGRLHTNDSGYNSRVNELYSLRYSTGLHTELPQYKCNLRRDQGRTGEQRKRGTHKNDGDRHVPVAI